MTLDALRARLSARPPRRAAEPGAPRASVALILAPGAEALELLFIRRAEHPRDPWSGHIGLPGGRSEPADADRLATAIRETREEVGIALTARELAGELDELSPTHAPVPVSVRPFVFRLAKRPRVRASAELAGHAWVPLPALRASERRTQVRERGQPLEVTAYCVGGFVIWGMTRRIVAPFMELVAELADPL